MESSYEMREAPPSPTSTEFLPSRQLPFSNRFRTSPSPSRGPSPSRAHSPSLTPLLASPQVYPIDRGMNEPGLAPPAPEHQNPSDSATRSNHPPPPKPKPTRSNTARRSEWAKVIDLEVSSRSLDQRGGPQSEPAYMQHIYLSKGRPQDSEQRNNAESEGWATIDKTLRAVDETKIRDTKEDMDTLLVFAGLFSAVLTAFNIESYKSLQQDPSELTAALVGLLVQSVNGFVINGSMINSTTPSSPDSIVFKPTSSAIRINAFWFTSLVFSLVTAALAMLVKQWLREFPPGDWVTAQEHIRIRNFRHQGLIQWRVLDIAGTLPLILQLSLTFFLIGLSEFTRELHPLVGWLTTTLIIIWFIVFVSTTIAPVLSLQCPYKTPLLQAPLNFTRDWFLRKKYDIQARRKGEPKARVPLHEGLIRGDPNADIGILNAADSFFLDDSLLPAVRWCLSEFRIEFVLDWVLGMVANRTGGQWPDGIDEFTLTAVAMNGLIPTVQTIFDAMERDLNYNLRFNKDSFTDGLSPYIQTAMVAIIRQALFVKELVGPESMFGAFVNKLLGLGPTVRRDLIRDVLSRDWFIPHTNPWITEQKMMEDVISTTSELLDFFEPVAPDRITCAVLNLTLHTDDKVLISLKPELNEIYVTLTSRLSEPAFRMQDDPLLQRDAGARTCLYICHLLDERLPGFVDSRLGNALKALTRQPIQLNERMPPS